MKEFLDHYNELTSLNLDLLSRMYTADVTFTDPAHEISGRENVRKYFASLYRNITSIRFDFHHPLKMDNCGYVQWVMTFSHPRLNGGHEIAVDGATFLLFAEDGRVCLHRDHFDLGSMLYRHIPVLGRLITSINGRLGS